MPLLSEILGASSSHPNSRIAQALASAGVAKTPELMRIVGLPRRQFDASTYPDASILYARGSCGKNTCLYCKKGQPALLPIQSAMIIEAAQNSGGFFNVGVGQGKTLASFLCHDAMEAHKTVLLVPSQLKTKTLGIDLPILQKHFKLPPIYEASQYKGQDGVYVIAYEELSSTNASDLLDKIRPDLIVADEAHKLRHKDSARTRRFLRFVRKNPCKFVAMTGSAMGKSILDFAHLIELALGKNSPVPADYPSLTQWVDCIDKEQTQIGALALMCDDTETPREGFSRRFRETPGVISTTESAAGMPIELRLFKVSPPASVLAALGKLEKDWAWDGEEYDQTLEIVRLERQLTQGFFYRAIWPSGIPDREWLEKRNAWKRAIRARLTHTNRVGADSPALLEAMAERQEWTPQEWFDWLGVRDRPEPGREAVEISKYLVDLASNWQISSPDPGIIWVDSPVVGEWLRESGIPFYGEGQDDEVNALAAKCLEIKISGGIGIPTIALSTRAHGTGKNLQAWARNLVLYPMAGNDGWEQMIGRTHRPGQIADCVELDIVLASPAAERALGNAQAFAQSVQETTNQPQKLNLCTVMPTDNRLETIAY